MFPLEKLKAVVKGNVAVFEQMAPGSGTSSNYSIRYYIMFKTMFKSNASILFNEQIFITLSYNFPSFIFFQYIKHHL